MSKPEAPMDVVDTAQVVIIGNGVAGYAAADRLARNGRQSVLIGPGSVADRPPLTKAALLAGTPTLLGDSTKMAERGITRIDGLVEDADLSARRVVISHEGSRTTLVADAIVLATGLDYGPPPVPGIELAHINARPDGVTLLAAELSSGTVRVAIVGAGLIGVETAATLAGAGHQVTVVDLESRPLNRLHAPVPEIAAAVLCQLGVTFIGEFRLRSIERAADGTLHLERDGGPSLIADVVIAATGGRHQGVPGLPDQLEAIAVGPDMGVPGYAAVFAAGDCAAPMHERFGRLTFPHWDTAVGTGVLAADAILGKADGYRRLPYWWSEMGSTRLGEVGVASAVTSWTDEGGLHVGRDGTDEVVCVLVINQPKRMREARNMLEPRP